MSEPLRASKRLSKIVKDPWKYEERWRRNRGQKPSRRHKKSKQKKILAKWRSINQNLHITPPIYRTTYSIIVDNDKAESIHISPASRREIFHLFIILLFSLFGNQKWNGWRKKNNNTPPQITKRWWNWRPRVLLTAHLPPLRLAK